MVRRRPFTYESQLPTGRPPQYLGQLRAFKMLIRSPFELNVSRSGVPALGCRHQQYGRDRTLNEAEVRGAVHVDIDHHDRDAAERWVYRTFLGGRLSNKFPAVVVDVQLDSKDGNNHDRNISEAAEGQRKTEESRKMTRPRPSARIRSSEKVDWA